jgi:uncharacterized protein YecE (DUF72 family)
MATVRIGISGWRYAPWRGVFYPEKLVQRDELHYASRQLRTIEINGSFYSLQSRDAYRSWYEQTPRGFVFAVKGPRFITHVRRLKEAHVPLANFFASGILALREKCGPMLWQLPASFHYDEDRIEAFLALLPHDSDQAVKIARRHDAHVARAHYATDRKRRIRHALEVRHDSFANQTFIDQLRRHRVALVVSDATGKWPRLEDVTANYMYLRLHGYKQLYSGQYSDAALRDWASRIRAWSRGGEPRTAKRSGTKPRNGASGRDVYCYFDNDAKVKAPFDAQRLRHRLGLWT